MQGVLKKEITMDGSHSLFLSDVPFNSGEKVVVFITTENALQKKLAQWQALFKETHSLPQLHEISEADIAAEIDAYKAGL